VQSHLPLYGKIWAVISIGIHVSIVWGHHTDFTHVQIHVESPCWPTESCLLWKSLPCELLAMDNGPFHVKFPTVTAFITCRPMPGNDMVLD